MLAQYRGKRRRVRWGPDGDPRIGKCAHIQPPAHCAGTGDCTPIGGKGPVHPLAGARLLQY